MTRQYDNAVAAECLRLALPLMAKNGVAVTPTNYAVWYEYVAKINPRLSEAMDRATGAQQTIDNANTAELYKLYVADLDEERLEGFRTALMSLADNIGGSVSKAGGDMQRYESSLAGVSEELAEPMQDGRLQKIVKSLAEETALIRSSGAEVHEMLEESRQEAETLRKELAKARQEASTDPLTSLANRKAFDRFLATLIDSDESSGQFCLIIGDIDRFKGINDTHGHLVGDKVIRYVAETMRKCAKGKDLVARLGGEEFSVLLPDTPLAGAVALANEIRRNVEAGRLVRSDTKEPVGTVTISLGAATWRHTDSAESLTRRADEALYRAKNAGRNRVEVEEPEAATGTDG